MPLSVGAGLALPTDVIHEVLASLCDFRTLSAAIMVSKAFYDVFQAHPKVIAHSVAANLIGPALPQAARAAHYVHQCAYPNLGRAADVPDESRFEGYAWDLTRDMGETLEQYAHAILLLEDFYSLRHKDRASRTSVLDAVESHRFRRAIYRHILCHDICKRGGFDPEDSDSGDTDTDDDGDDGDDNDDANALKTQIAISEFLQSVPSSELFEFVEVCAFVIDTKAWQLRAWCRVSHWNAGRDLVPVNVLPLAERLERRELRSVEVPEDIDLYSYKVLSDAAKDVLRHRHVSEDQLNDVSTKHILESVHGEQDTCSRCGAVGGVQLLGPTNIDLLDGLVTIHEQAQLLPGLLPRNRDVTQEINRHLTHLQNVNHGTDKIVVEQMMDMELEGEDDDGEQWSKDRCYCLECIKHLFRQRLMLWWRQERLTLGKPLLEDCWYGYNCRTMTHRASHATKLNHLCKPTRGDAPATAPGQGNVN
ncbi:hypothetical protein C8Q77DRAFT_1079530 [Trametes polyzona]|nr:hypothetical protein C8Q77DRAFT_1079530 [Trametes polyzona]